MRSSGRKCFWDPRREHATELWRWRDTYDPLVVFVPKTLLTKGWMKHGRIGFHEVPSQPMLAAHVD